MNGYQPKSNGLGIENLFKDIIGARKGTWKLTGVTFKSLVSLAKLYKYPVIGTILKTAGMFSPYRSRFTQGVVLPFDVDLTQASENVVLPIEMMKETLRGAGYILALNSCICRDAFDCKTYPHDIACLFMGNAARITEKHGLGRQVTAEEACAIVDRAADLGMVGQALWIEVEQYIWGFQNEDMEKFLEFCFCCPCCCSCMGVIKNATRDVKRRFRTSGWQVEVDTDVCEGCGSCATTCPQAAITLQDGKAVISQECFGCGICKRNCKPGALKTHLVRPMQADVRDYFVGLKLDLK